MGASCNDPWVMDDNWHRGAYMVFVLRGTNIVEEERTNDGPGDAFDRFMSRVKTAGYVGNMEFINTSDLNYRLLRSNEQY